MHKLRVCMKLSCHCQNIQLFLGTVADTIALYVFASEELLLACTKYGCLIKVANVLTNIDTNSTTDSHLRFSA